VYKIAAGAAQLANRILLHFYCLFTYNCGYQLREHKQNIIIHYSLFNSLA